jgi:hypothetical protein
MAISADVKKGFLIALGVMAALVIVGWLLKLV